LKKAIRNRRQTILRWAAMGFVIGLAICLAIVIHRTQPERIDSLEGKDAPPSPMYKVTAERPADPPLPDPFIEIIDDELMVDPELVETMILVPKDKRHAQRVENIDGRTVQQLVHDLANFDDMHLALTSVGYDIAPGTYDFLVHTMAHLFRVRRLLAIEEKNPGTVTPVMMAAYAKVPEEWPAAYRGWIKRVTGPPKMDYEPLEIEKVEMRAAAATYFMGETGDPALLGVLLDGYQAHQKLLHEIKFVAKSPCPVPPPFTLYAIHRLVSTIPEASLRSEEARAARKTYLSWAEDQIPPPDEVEVSAWNAEYDESDPLRTIADPKNLLLRDQPKMVMKVYPPRHKYGAPFWIRDRSDEARVRDRSDSPQQCEEWRDRLFAAARAIIER